MPTNSLIVGVDLAPIKSIPRTITIQSDITTNKCRATIRQHLKTWKADTVLHDGAPNVGVAWVQDAYSQAELTLQALKLATDFLVEGGTFVTKVFRSKDYNALLWVFNQLFTKVEATKPPSSRNVSAEIFIVCRGFKAPKRIDPRLLDPRSVFAELTDPTPNNEAKVFNPAKKKRKREGYEEGDYVQFKEVPASDFIQTTDPIALLGSLNKLTFKQARNGDVALAALEQLPETTEEVKNCCSDLRVLGRKEFRVLLRWRLKAREIFGFKVKKEDENPKPGDEVAEVTPMDEELKVHEELHDMHSRETSRKKRERRRENEKKQKDIVRMQLHMMAPIEIGLEQIGPFGEGAVFNLTQLHRSGNTAKIARGSHSAPFTDDIDKIEESDDFPEEADDIEDQLDGELDALYDQYQQRKAESNAKLRAKKARSEQADVDWQGFSGDDEGKDCNSDQEVDTEDASSGDEDSGTTSQLVTFDDQTSSGAKLSRKTAMFFDQDIFKDIDGLALDDDQDSGIDVESDSPVPQDFIAQKPVEDQPKKPQKKHGPEGVIHSKDGYGSTGPTQKNDDGFEVVCLPGDERWDESNEPSAKDQAGTLGMSTFICSANLDITDIDIITAEAMTLAQQLATGQKSTIDVIDEGFNKYAFRDRDGLPEWFLDDEGRHSKPQKPITAAGAAAIKEKLRALNARPIKKVREAKDRKKFKAAQRLEKLRKKSALLADDEGISEKDKASNIAKMMSRATKKKPKQQVKVVVAKGGNRGISGRPKGVKGKYKIVDPRLKKDVRAEKRIAKARR